VIKIPCGRGDNSPRWAVEPDKMIIIIIIIIIIFLCMVIVVSCLRGLNYRSKHVAYISR
jgi:hypothetical protein